MPINLFENKSNISGNKIDTSIIVQKANFGTNYKEDNIEEDIGMKKLFKVKSLPCPQENPDDVCKSYFDSGLNHPSIIRTQLTLTSMIKILITLDFSK